MLFTIQAERKKINLTMTLMISLLKFDGKV